MATPEPTRRRAVGIDLGTTNTVLAEKGAFLRLRGIPGAVMPSAVAFVPTGERLVGPAALDRLPIDPKNTIVSAKRLIGERWGGDIARRFADLYPYDLEQTHDGHVGFQVRAGGFDPRDIAAMILTDCCVLAKVKPAETEVVITIPAGFSAARRQATLAAVERLGFQAVHMIEECVASAVAHLDRANLKLGAVYDLGGGTFEFGVLDCSRRPFRVIGFGADPFLGGDDIDRAIAAWATDRVLRSMGWDMSSDPETAARLVFESQKAKIRLGTQDAAPIALRAADPAAPACLPELVLDRATLVDLSRPLVQRSLDICDETLERLGLRLGDLQAVFLAGGGTLLHGLREEAERHFGRPPRRDVDPIYVVAVGASIVAARSSLRGLDFCDQEPPAS